ncbi:MAG: ABC transporter substrate-binding protein [Variibacter sp.]|nr:ABC transporter substrate-binding protein [Variibacter sp.]
MLSRRHFNTLLGSVGITLLSVHQGRGQSVPVVRMGNAAGIIDPQITFLTVGQNKRTPFFEQEGVKLDIINMSGVGQTMQSLAAGNCETSAISPVPFLNVYAKNPAIDLIFPYCWLRQPHWSVAVKPDSPVKSLQELKGKTIGIRNQGDTGYISGRVMFKELGINPDKDVEWVSVGDGGPAGQALHSGRIDAMALWDGAFARVELAGFKLRYLPNSPGMKHLFGNAYAVRKSDLPKNRDVYVRFFRAMAKSTVFAYTNPDVSIKLHYEVYPESKPKGKTDAEALKEARHINDSRRAKWYAGEWQSDKRMGAMSKEEWEAQVRFAGLEDQIKDITPVFTTDLIDEINKFDKAAIEKMAREMKL